MGSILKKILSWSVYHHHISSETIIMVKIAAGATSSFFCVGHPGGAAYGAVKTHGLGGGAQGNFAPVIYPLSRSSGYDNTRLVVPGEGHTGKLELKNSTVSMQGKVFFPWKKARTK